MSTNISMPGTTKKNASYVVTLDQFFWVKGEARRRGVSEAEVVRDAISRAMAEAEADTPEAQPEEARAA